MKGVFKVTDTPVLGTIVTNPLGDELAKFRGFIVPRYFEATFQFPDNKNVKVTKSNANKFKRWKVILWLRFGDDNRAEIVKFEIVGAQENPPFVIFTTKPLQPSQLFPVQARHLEFVQNRRAKFISFSIQALIQQVETQVDSEGRVKFLFSRIEVPLQKLEDIDDRIQDVGYKRLDDIFLSEVATRFNKLVSEGETRPIPVLQTLFYPDSSTSSVERWVSMARRAGKKLLDVPGKKVSSPQGGKKKTQEKGKNGKTKKGSTKNRN